MFKLKEGYSTVLELATDDSLCTKAQTVSVEGDGLLKVGDRQSDDCDSGSHDGSVR